MQQQIEFIAELAKQYKTYSHRPAELLAAINSLSETELRMINAEYTREQFQPVNLLRFEITRQLLEGAQIDSQRIEEIKGKIRTKDEQYFHHLPDQILLGLAAHPMGKRDWFANWQKDWSVFHTFFYRGTAKETTQIYLEQLCNQLLTDLDIVDYTFHWVDFQGASNYGSDRCWLALFPQNKSSHKDARQFFLSIDPEIRVGRIDGTNLDAGERDTENVQTYEQIVSVFRRIETEVVQFNRNARNYFKFSPGELGRHWDLFKQEGIAALSYRNLEIGDLSQIRTREELNISVGFAGDSMSNETWNLWLFKTANVGDVVFASKGVSHCLGIGMIEGDYYFDSEAEDYQHRRRVNWITDKVYQYAAHSFSDYKTLFRENFRLFLELLDRDVYGDIKSLEDAMQRKEAPFYLRRTKEALVTFPNPETGKSEKIFTKRDVKTTTFQIDLDEADLYHELTRYVEDQSIKAAQLDSARGRVLGFTMAMLQRRFASSIYALRRSLQRMQDKRQAILDDPEKYRREQMEKKKPEDFDDLPEAEQAKIIEELEGVVASVDPAALREEIQELGSLVDSAIELERREVESKLSHLKDELVRTGIFEDPTTKLLIFTEHKDTLDYLVEKLREWGLSVTQIHGGMHVGDRDTPGTRIYAEREFKESAQVMVATEAAGEGINLQFCWFMINYDLPWNPMRLEQRMGRIHRYGQTKDCLILNFVSTNTREGRVLEKLLSKLAEISKELGTDQVFDVIGEMLPPNMIERMFRDMYAKSLMEQGALDRIVHEVDVEKIRHISESTLEGLAKRSLNISALTQRRAEAKERRLVPEVIEDFFLDAAPVTGLQPKEIPGKENTYRIGRVPRTLTAIGDQIESQYGKLGREYKQIVFDKAMADKDPKSEWVTPGHPLFESMRIDIDRQAKIDLQHGSILYDLNTDEPYRLDTFTAAVKDGLNNVVHRRLFVVKTNMSGKLELREPTLFLDLALSEKNTRLPENLMDSGIPGREGGESFLYSEALQPLLAEVQAEREHESTNVLRHIQTSLNELISRQTIRHMELLAQHEWVILSL